MKIGFDISALSLPKSGVGQYQVNLLNALLKLDQENTYNLYAFNLRNRKRFKELNFPTGYYGINALPIPQRLITAWWLAFSFPSLESVVGECDLFHVSEICIPPVKKAKTVAFIHDLTTVLRPKHHTKGNIFLHKSRFKNIHKVDAILTNSEHTKTDIIKHLRINPEKIFVTYLGADEQFRPYDIPEIEAVFQKFRFKKQYILFVGTLEPRKNVKTLIRAFNILKKETNLPHNLVLVGQKGWKYGDIFREIEHSDFKSEIIYLDYVSDSDIPGLMNGADVFIYPSFYEGFGLPVLEAMQCGTPVITSNLSSLPEVGGNACLYVDPKSEEEMAGKLYSVLTDKMLWRMLSLKGIERAKCFSWEKCALDTLKVYETVMGC